MEKPKQDKRDYEGSLGEEIWAGIAAGVDAGRFTEAQAHDLYRKWLSTYRWGKAAREGAVRGSEPSVRNFTASTSWSHENDKRKGGSDMPNDKDGLNTTDDVPDNEPDAVVTPDEPATNQ